MISNFKSFCANIKPELVYSEPCCFNTCIIPNYEDEIKNIRTKDTDDYHSFSGPDLIQQPTTVPTTEKELQASEGDNSQTTKVIFHDLPMNNIVPEDQEINTLPPKDEILHWNYHLGHVSFFKLKLMSQQGILPSRLANITPPFCVACAYGKLTRLPKKTKPAKDPDHFLKTSTKPGMCVSVDQLESMSPWFI